MNLKEAIELIDPEIEEELNCKDKSCKDKIQCNHCTFKLQGRLSQMKREVLRLEPYVNFMDVCNTDNSKTAEIKCKLIADGYHLIEALNILINHLEEELK